MTFASATFGQIILQHKSLCTKHLPKPRGWPISFKCYQTEQNSWKSKGYGHGLEAAVVTACPASHPSQPLLSTSEAMGPPTYT